MSSLEPYRNSQPPRLNLSGLKLNDSNTKIYTTSTNTKNPPLNIDNRLLLPPIIQKRILPGFNMNATPSLSLSKISISQNCSPSQNFRKFLFQSPVKPIKENSNSNDCIDENLLPNINKSKIEKLAQIREQLSSEYLNDKYSGIDQFVRPQSRSLNKTKSSSVITSVEEEEKKIKKGKPNQTPMLFNPRKKKFDRKNIPRLNLETIQPPKIIAEVLVKEEPPLIKIKNPIPFFGLNQSKTGNFSQNLDINESKELMS